MTNGEKMQELFPEGKKRRCRGGVVFESDGWCHAYDSDWWNAEYKGPTKNDSSELEKNSKKLEKDFGELDCISREQAYKTIKENLCAMCAYSSRCMESCDIRSCDNRDAMKVLEQEPSWIPVEEKMPEDGQSVLFCDIDNDIMIGYHIKSRHKTHFSQDGTYEDIKNVRAWMPLPQPYKPQESEDKE